MMTRPIPLPLPHPHTLQACCPTCQQVGTFRLLGVQQWPPTVAEKMGVPEAIGTYQCDQCDTTISEMDLNA